MKCSAEQPRDALSCIFDGMDEDRVVSHAVVAANCHEVPTVEWWTEAMHKSGTEEALKLLRDAHLCLQQNQPWGEFVTIAEHIIAERGITR